MTEAKWERNPEDDQTDALFELMKLREDSPEQQFAERWFYWMLQGHPHEWEEEKRRLGWSGWEMFRREDGEYEVRKARK